MATVVDALGRASANAGWVAARPNGVVVRVKRLGFTNKLCRDHWNPWQPNVLDLVADDWEAGPMEQVMKALQAAAAADGASA